jgi:hypothetical protein
MDFYQPAGNRLNKNYKIIFSLLYAFNSYTFYNFCFIWGYTPFFVFIPPDAGYFWSYL